MSEEAVPQRIGRYAIRRELGRGTMGVVYEAFDSALDRTVALKIIRPLFVSSPADQEGFERRFLAEARIAARLAHPGIVVVHEVDRDPESGALYIALERLEGEPLSVPIAEDRRPHWNESLRLVARVAEALHHAHAAGVVHRDVKPANIMRLPSGEPKIMDFGLAKEAEELERLTGSRFVGTPQYMAPEQIRGERVDGRADLFALGVVAYVLLTGRKPFAADSVPKVALRVVHDDPVPPTEIAPGLPAGVDDILLRAMAKQPRDRYPDGFTMAEDIDDVLGGREPRPRRQWPAPARASDPLSNSLAPRPRKRGAQPLRVLALGMLAAGLVALILSTRWPGQARRVVLARPSRAALAPSAAPARDAPTAAKSTSMPVPPEPTAPGLSPSRLLVQTEGEAGGRLRIFVDDVVVLDSSAGRPEPIAVRPGNHVVRVQLDRPDRIETRELMGTFESGGERALALRAPPLGALELQWK